MIDVIYPVHNRLFYTQMTFPRLLHECDLYKDCTLWIFDDDSQDGSSEFIQYLIEGRDNVNYYKDVIGNSTFCINHVLSNGKAEYIYKVDNDIIIPEGSFSNMVNIIPKECGFLMMGESENYPDLGECEIIETDRTHIGGVGLFRREAFSSLIKGNRRFFGFTQYQIEAKKRGWKCMEVDSTNMNLDLCEWYCRSKEYETKGWGRIINKVKSIWQT
jgi:hypothetical protein